ncbi:MAG TPA: MFS transporter [Bryobacteraceae bacterium]|nr:MFS transporter [Bryobacteraceae bacterium]
MLILSAVLAIFVYGLIAPMLGALLPTYLLTPTQEGNIATAQAIGLVISSLSAGPFIDLKGNKAALVSGLTLVCLALFALPNAGGYAGLIIIYLVLGIGGGIVVTAANALVGAVEPGRRGSALNFLNLFFGLGGIVTTWAASYVLSPVFLCYSIAILTLIALIVNAVTKMPAPSGAASFRLNEVPGLLSRPVLILLSFFLFLYVACEVGMWNWLKKYLITVNFDPKTAGGVVSYGFALGLLVGRLVVSRLLVRISALTVTLFASICMAITTYAVLALHTQTSVTIAVFCAGLAMAPVFPTTLALAQDAFPRGTATALGIVITCGWLGLVVSSPIIGNVSAGSTLHRALLLLPFFSLVMVLASLVLRALLRRPAADVALASNVR